MVHIAKAETSQRINVFTGSTKGLIIYTLQTLRHFGIIEQISA